MSGALAQDEVLTINGVTVNLTAGMDINAVVSAINAKQNSLGIRASATGSDGAGTGAFLTLTSVGYGSGAAVTPSRSAAGMPPVRPERERGRRGWMWPAPSTASLRRAADAS